jgi:hypothetical protein
MFTPSTGKSRNWFTKVRHRYPGHDGLSANQKLFPETLVQTGFEDIGPVKAALLQSTSELPVNLPRA